jgi:hypothetical protein
MMPRLGLFSLGGALSLYWRPRYPLLPWALTSALMMTAGVWDRWASGAPVEWIVVGLAAYELMIGLLDAPQASRAAREARSSSTAPRRAWR